MKDHIAPQPDASADQLMRAYRELETAPHQAVTTLIPMAEGGTPMAMLYLAYAFRNGIGVACDLELAEAWYRRAVDAGLHRAHYHLGRLFLDSSRYAEAMMEFEQAASKSFMPGVHFLGRIYYFGLGVPADKEKGRELLSEAAGWGCVFAKALVAHDLIRRGEDIWSVFRGAFTKLGCYVELLRIAWSEGTGSDRLR